MVENKGYFGQFGGSFVPEPIQVLLDELEGTFEKYKNAPEFLAEYHHYLADDAGRETPLYFAESLTDYLGGAKIYLKRENLNHLGSHKLNNVLGQILLAKRMGKTRVIAETGAGQHGVATAASAAKFGMKTYALFSENDQVAPVYSISAGLAYPGVGPEHAFFKDSGRVEYVAATDDEVVDALLLLTRKEGILPAIESSRAIAEAVKRASQLSKDNIIIVNVSGRGDKDVAAIADYLEKRNTKNQE